MRPHRCDFALRPNLDAALAEFPVGIPAKLFAELRQNVFARMHKHEPKHFLFEIWIEPQRDTQAIVNADDSFNASKTSTGDHECEQGRTFGTCTFGIRFFQMCDQSVTQLDRVAKRFHCQRPLCYTGQVEKVRYRSERQNKMIVFERVRVPIKSMRNNDLFFIDVDLVHITAEKIHAANHFADRINDVRQIQIARRDLVQHRCEQKKVLAIDHRDFELRIATLLKFKRRVKPTEPAAKNENTCLVRHNRGILRQEQSVPVEAAHLATTLETDIRVACAAARHRKFRRRDRVQPRSDAGRLAGEIWHALLLLLRMWSRGRAPMLQQMRQSTRARPYPDDKQNLWRASRLHSAARIPVRRERASATRSA